MPALPLCVDLDGTLIRTDSLHEALMVALRAPLKLFRAAARLFKGKAPFKAAIYDLARLDATHLPYNEKLIVYIREQKDSGREVYLVTAADRLIADAVSDHMGFFDGVICSDGLENVRGHNKASRLVERFGAKAFVYAGNDASDLKVWKEAAAGVLVDTPDGVTAQARKTVPIEAEFQHRISPLLPLVKAARPHQWAKNALVFLPVFASTQFTDWVAWERTAALFVSFCFAASAIYIVNDLVDLNADRRHPRKRTRPFASGRVSVKLGLAATATLGLLAAAVAWPLNALPLVLGYAVLSTSYSFVLKEKALVDVFILASLYTVRIFAGGVVSGHMVTEWLVGFSIFMFLSLALAKRVAELQGTGARAGGRLSRRAYADVDISILQTMGVASAFVAALVLSLYLQSQAAHSIYAQPIWLFAVAVAVLFWFARVWLKTARGEMHDDPVVWAVSDRPSQVLGLITAAALVAAVGRLPS
jgi:4-hydroxybenzoate polyprenyltransferase/phosphoserine phosphatase